MTIRPRPALARMFTALACATLAVPAFAGDPMPRGYPGRGRIGIEVQPMTAELREFFAAPASQGLLIVRVEPGRPADAAGLRVGDVVVTAAGEPLVRTHDLVAIVARAPAGEPLALTVVREKKTHEVEVRPEGAPATAEALRAWHDRIDEPLPAAPPAAASEPSQAPAVPDATVAPSAEPSAPAPAAPAPDEMPEVPPPVAPAPAEAPAAPPSAP